MYKYIGDTGIQWYTFINNFSRVLAVIVTFIVLVYKENTLGRCSELFMGKITKKKKNPSALVWIFFCALEAFGIYYAQFHLGGMNGIFGDLVGTGVNYFGTIFVSPIMVSLFGLLFGWDIFRLMDIITLTYPFRLIFVKLACFCQGCCRGIECSFGLFNHSSGQTEFPVQLVEMFWAAAILIFLIHYKKKAKEGTLFPMYVILYCATRFFSEFLRTEENYFLFLKKYHILCLVGIAFGVLLLYVVKTYKEKIKGFYSDYFDAAEDILDDIAIRMGIKRDREIVHRKKKKNAKRAPIQTTAQKNRISDMKKWIIIWVLGLIGQIGWNIEGTWFNTFVYEKVDKNPSILTPMLIASAFASTASIFIFGTLTDRTGKRRTLVSSGFVIWGILIACFPLTQYIVKNGLAIAVIYMVVMDMLLSFAGSVSTDVGYSTWITDIMNDRNRGQIGGAIAIQAVLGSMLGNIIGGYVIGTENNYLRLFIVMGSMLSISGMVSIFLFDKKDDVRPTINGSFTKQLASVFNFRNLLKNKELLLILAAVGIYYIGYNVYFPHVGNILIDYLGYTASQTGIIKAVPTIFAMLATMPISKFINKNKFVQSALIAVITTLIGGLLIFKITPEDIDPEKTFSFRVFACVFMISASYIVMLQTTKTWTKNLTPKDTKGQFEGLWAVAFALIPHLFGSYTGEWVVKNYGESVFNKLSQRTEYIPDGTIFLVGVIISACSILPIVAAKLMLDKKARKAEKENQI